MKALKNIQNIKIYDATLYHLKQVEKDYQKYIKQLQNLSIQQLELFLEKQKQDELQIIHKSETLADDEINAVAKMIVADELNLSNLEELHKMTITKTDADKSENYKYRNRSVKVGHVIDGKEVVSYIPPHPDDVIFYAIKILRFLNEENEQKIFNNIFIKPLIAHAYFALLQPFADGNTRLARLIQHGKILELTNKRYGTDFKYPTFYLSKKYLKNSGYRSKIKLLANLSNNDAWNTWFQYNLKLMDEQIKDLTGEIRTI